MVVVVGGMKEWKVDMRASFIFLVLVSVCKSTVFIVYSNPIIMIITENIRLRHYI